MDLLITIAAQLPVVVIFVYFVLQMLDRNEKSIERREQQWQKFLDENQERSIDAYKSVANELKALIKCITDQGELLRSHDGRVAELTERVEGYIDGHAPVRKSPKQPKEARYGGG